MTKSKISIVINTINEVEHLKVCLPKLGFADEIVIIDMESTDGSGLVAKEFTDKIYRHKFSSFVEPIRNFGISKATGSWVLILDPDEEVSPTLSAKLIEIANNNLADFVKIPRKNIIFNQWMQHSRWWPDYNIRFFKKGAVTWQDEIHSVPRTSGRELSLESTPELAIIHHHYSTINEYLTRLIRYSDQQSKELIASGYKFSFFDTINKSFGEFLSRYFAGEGYKDGFHGLVMATLQAFSILVVYLKVWQEQGFATEKKIVDNPAWQMIFRDRFRELKYWIYTVKIHLTPQKTFRFFLKLKRKFTI